MIKKLLLPLLLLLTLFLGEIHTLSATKEVNNRDWFLLIDLEQDIEWYIKDTAEGVIWLVFLFVWYTREKAKNRFWANWILMFLIFRFIDIIIYWLNHRHAGKVYLFCYLSIIIYGTISSIKFYKRNK